jgi:Cd2+/Zn2+-exporting ATPase
MNKLQVEIRENLHSREARRVEQILIKKTGISNVSISASGVMLVEWDANKTNQSEILKSIEKIGLHFVNVKRDNENSNKEDKEHYSYLHILGENTELYYAITSGVFWISGAILSFTATSENIITTLFVIGAVIGGVFTFSSAGKDLLRGKFEIDFLMLFAAIGAAILGHWGESALLLFLFSLGHALEEYAMKRARKSISALSDLAPPTALLKHNGELKEVNIEQLKVGDIIVVKPNSNIAADGVVIKGTSPVNQAAITGESMPVTKHPSQNWQDREDIKKLPPEHRVFAGTINGNGALEIKVLKEAKDSTLSRLIFLVKEAETQKSPTQLLKIILKNTMFLLF